MPQIDDLISRSAAIERLRDLHDKSMDSAIVELCIMPPLKRERVKRGKWTPDEESGYICNQCLIRACRQHNYCPECGAKMEK